MCVSLTLHVDGKGDLLWIQFIPADLWSGDALRHRAGQRDTSTHINLSIPLACRQRRRCFRKIEEYISGQDSSHKNRCTWTGFAHKTSTGTWTLFDITIMLCLFDDCFRNVCDLFYVKPLSSPMELCHTRLPRTLSSSSPIPGSAVSGGLLTIQR